MVITRSNFDRSSEKMISYCSRESRRHWVMRSISAVRSRAAAASFSRVAALSFALAAFSFASAIFLSEISCNLSPASSAFRPNQISPHTPSAMTIVAKTSNPVSHWEWPSEKRSNTITSAASPPTIAQAENLSHLWAFEASPLSSSSVMFLGYYYKRRVEALRKSRIRAIGILFISVLVLFAHLLR